jgi:hypothetical protein
MAKCANCGAGMSCGCQKRTASNGATACSSCINTLESKLKNAKVTAARVASTVQKTAQPNEWGANRYNKTK